MTPITKAVLDVAWGIEAIGSRDSISVPGGAKVIEAAGKTIIPGLIDAHAHGSQGDDEIIPNQIR